MHLRAKDLDFSKEAVEDLADMAISDRRVFALLTLVLPSIDVRTHHFHIDHIFPRAALQRPNFATPEWPTNTRMPTATAPIE